MIRQRLEQIFPNARIQGMRRRQSAAVSSTRLPPVLSANPPAARETARSATRRQLIRAGQMRGKIGLTMLDDGAWAAAYGHALNTWIAKVEDHPRLPGEAGIEAICQRAFAALGIDSAETASQIFDGVQTVLSQRSDRVGAPETGIVRPRHQEDMAQALGYPCALKYDAGWRTEPRWRECHRLLSARAKDPDAEHRRLTQILAATWLIGHSDLHRRNLGFVHAEDGSPPSITIAPLYDVSSARGLKNIDQTLAIGIARQLGLTRIRPRVPERGGDLHRRHTRRVRLRHRTEAESDRARRRHHAVRHR